MPVTDIEIKGAREHNLRDVSLVLPRNKLICLTGVSGSGKSSLAFDTVYAEGQRRYVESLSSYARQFMGQMPKPEVDYIGGLTPSISISQKTTGNNPRSTVGTITEINDFLRILFARIGKGHCNECGKELTAQTKEQILEHILGMEKDSQIVILAPLIRGQKGEHRDLFIDLLKQGFVRARVDGRIINLTDDLMLDRQLRHNVELVVDRLTITQSVRGRLAEAVELAMKMGDGSLIIAPRVEEDEEEAEAPETPAKKTRTRKKQKKNEVAGDMMFSVDYACVDCGVSFDPPTPQLFSFNSPHGMCPVCDGLGQIYTFDPELLVPDVTLTFKKGAIEILGKWTDLGRWKRHIYKGVAETMERKLNLDAGAFLDTPWRDMDENVKQILLHGAGEQHITFTWRAGSAPQKYGGTYDGIVPEMLEKYRNSNSKPQIRQLEKYMSTVGCPECGGQRLNAQARFVKLGSTSKAFTDKPVLSLPEVSELAIQDATEFFAHLDLDAMSQKIGAEAIKEVRGRLGFLENVGLEYLTLSRTAPTLSGGESQRIRLAGQIGCGLVGVTYILDEPSIGLHPRDNDRLLATLNDLRDLGNTVLVVEHDEDTMRVADHVIDFGPGAGVRGGFIVAQGLAEEIAANPDSVTGRFLAGTEKIDVPETRRHIGEKKLTIVGAAENNLKNVNVEIPLGGFVCVTGVSGSGKSSVVNDILVEALRRDLNHGLGEPGAHERIDGLEHLDKMIAIDQSPIGRTPRSNPATYIKVFDDIRNLFAQLPESRRRGYKPGRFSFNVDGGRCSACEGNGANKLEMDFLADIWVTCPVCEGHRFNRETLEVRFKEASISDVLEMDVQEALKLFENVPTIAHKLQTLHDVGLDYIKLGQPSPTLSGGEAQRIKLAKELVKRSTGRTLYLLDEPTTGLHFADVKMLLKVLHAFAEQGNTVLVVEHNLDVIKTADWLIDMGPEGGSTGGHVVACGTPETVADVAESHTGQALKAILAGKQSRAVTEIKRAAKAAQHKRDQKAAKVIDVRGANMHNLKNVDAQIDREKMTVFCGPSGSGKSSLAMDTIYAEGQRRYVESLSAYARQFVGQMQKPRVDHIEGLSPAIAIEQKNLGNSPRSTVGTVTEIYDYLRVMMPRLGTPYCPDCEIPISTQTSSMITDKILTEPPETKLFLMAPITLEVGQQYAELWEDLKTTGYQRIRVDGVVHTLDKPPKVDRRRHHDVEVIVDRISVKEESRTRIADSVENGLSLGAGFLHVAYVDEKMPEHRWRVKRHSQKLSCGNCDRSFDQLSPHNFSFNSQLGWCPDCEGLGTQTGADPTALLSDPKLTLREGALKLWPGVQHDISLLMLEALSAGAGVPLDTPFERLSSRHRRVLLHGTADQWFDVHSGEDQAQRPIFRFQFKGLYPALEEASRLSQAFRMQLESLVAEVECTTCCGSRLRDDTSAVRFRDQTVLDICSMPMGMLLEFIQGWKLKKRETKIAGEIVRELENRVQFLCDVGLEYLTLRRTAPTLSAGEAQRIRLASQLGSGLCGVLYVLDEPTIGLHPRDNRRLLAALHRLRDLGNTLIVVEHDHEVIEGSDKLLDFGPQAGVNGGTIVASGTPKQVGKNKDSVTGPYISGKKAISVPSNRRMPSIRKLAAQGEPFDFTSPSGDWLEVVGARHNNLHNINVRLPLGALIAIAGPSGSGKSSLMQEVIYNSLARTLHRASTTPGAHDAIRGIEAINKVIRVDQQPLGNSPSSNAATYTGVFDVIRDLFSQLPEAKLRGYTPRRFSFNVEGGRCDVCEGMGQKCIEMHFLPDVWVTCETCDGHRYNEETLSVRYHGQSIADVLEMPIGQAVTLFENIPKIRRILQTLCDVGLDYVTLGQPAPTLSGGEAQRVKLAAELARPDTGKTLYLLDEPTTGLHFEDLRKLLDVFHRLVDLGNTVVVIEHNLDVMKQADWILEIGPEAGADGGRLVTAGTPEDVVDYSNAFDKGEEPYRSHTGEALKPYLAAGPYEERGSFDPSKAEDEREGDMDIADVGRATKMPWEMDGRRWHTKDRVGRTGEACNWDGNILSAVVDRIIDIGEFSDINWNSRTIVEISGLKKSDGWFFHAITGETWLLKMKFRVHKGTFDRMELPSRLALPTLNELEDLPIYSNEPRVKVKNLRGPFQEIEIRAHTYEEVNRSEFWEFLEQAVAGFDKYLSLLTQNVEDHMPWKKLGEKWHLSRKGFPPGKNAQWDANVLEDLLSLLMETADDAEILWNNQMIVNVMAAGVSGSWASVTSKRPEDVRLTIRVPRGSVALGRIAGLGQEPDIDAKPDGDVVKIHFRTTEDLEKGDLSEFLQETLQAIADANGQKKLF
ncbi:excinuclease ABC subunit UvrA [Blastopirellula marina]|uniref:UvrABC system protein A n=1 Tax=Blastopirellula marina DSM 3645 TaxID=314230 RepID=A4A2W9_9BACT|nr:excinuclease ABC subunit UvrA [Blastopirellula marina]EAQ76886.1 exinuclease ABC subunit A [Blastopirellula marina DSM 3645]